MNFFIILFFISLFGIVFMIGRKLRKFATEGIPEESAPFDIGTIHIEVWRRNGTKILQRLMYFLLVEIIRVYVRLSEASRREWIILKAKLRDKLTRKIVLEEGTIRREPNKFLKAMAGYKRKIRRIQQQVREEEGLE